MLGHNTVTMSTRALARGLEAIELVAACPSGCAFTTFVHRLGLPNQTVARLLRGLCALGYLRHAAARGLYVPGERLGWLGSQEDAEQRLRRLAMPVLRRLAHRHGLCGFLLRWTGRHVICIDRADGPSLALFQEIGHVTQDLRQAPWSLFTGPAPAGVDGRWWRREARRLASRGWTACMAKDRRRIAAPVRDGAGSVIGALVLGGLPADLDPRLALVGDDLAAAARLVAR